MVDPYIRWRFFFDVAISYKGSGIGAVLISEIRQHYPMAAILKFHYTNNMDEYEACILGLRMALDIDINELLFIGNFNLLIHQIQGDLIKVPPSELNAMSSPWPFIAGGIDVVGPIEPAVSNEHIFILVAIDYFTKCVEVTSHKSMTKKVIADFVRNNIIYCIDIPEFIVMDNGANLNSNLMKDICKQFKIAYRNSIAYRPQINEAVEAANKNIKRILRKMTYNYKVWHQQLPYALFGYHTTTRTSTGVTPYLLVYGTKAVIPAEVEIPSLRIIQEAELANAECVRATGFN
ncbi:uncharacterized protein LOC132039099 [Lycium ferocissimum]|uniref:uncharacterized protein LOC132039099 n=1 Tax=Lycium ferocissimum TaxID=112874 RepID=UPI00281622CD|nr:uncharacterized protein LOC132039099 [Lycium ferocissimum]